MRGHAKGGVGILMTSKMYSRMHAINSYTISTNLDFKINITFIELCVTTEDSDVQSKRNVMWS